MRARGRGGAAFGAPWPVVVVVVGVGLALAPPSSSSVHQILWGRCYSYCIHSHLRQQVTGLGLCLGCEASAGSFSVSWSEPTDVGEREVSDLPRHPIKACQRHRVCRWCLYVCERPEEGFTTSASCLRDCNVSRAGPRSAGHRACVDACSFLRRAATARGGTCPSPGSLQGFQAACVHSCASDSDCGHVQHKCCANTCGNVCSQPVHLHFLPPVPTHLRFKLLHSGAVLIRWETGHGDMPGGPRDMSGGHRDMPGGHRDMSGGHRDMSGGERDPETEDSPVVYILRWWCAHTKGAISSVTDRARTRLQGYPSGISAGSRCHFMVAAVNLHGSRGFSTVSPYTKKFLLPSPPRNLDQGASTLNHNQVDVTMQWQPPVYTDGLPVAAYQVFWSDSLPRASASYLRLHMNRRTLAADKFSYVIRSLSLGTIYFVQVRAVVRWKGRRTVGKPASTYIETYSPPQPANAGPRTEVTETAEREASVIHSITVHQSFFQDTMLKANVTWTLKPGKNASKYLIYWRAHICARSEHRKTHPRLETSATSHDRSFTLYNLRPECEYAVRVRPVNMRSRAGTATITSFLTPACHLIEVRGGQAPSCQTATPEPVQGLHAETSQCGTLVRWDLPHTSPLTTELVTFEVMWGPTKPGLSSDVIYTASPGQVSSDVIYTASPGQVSVPADRTVVVLGRLRGGDHYTVQVIATSAEGSSQPALLHLVAPPAPDAAGTDSFTNCSQAPWNSRVTSQDVADDDFETSLVKDSHSRGDSKETQMTLPSTTVTSDLKLTRPDPEARRGVECCGEDGADGGQGSVKTAGSAATPGVSAPPLHPSTQHVNHATKDGEERVLGITTSDTYSTGLSTGASHPQRNTQTTDSDAVTDRPPVIKTDTGQNVNTVTVVNVTWSDVNTHFEMSDTMARGSGVGFSISTVLFGVCGILVTTPL